MSRKAKVLSVMGVLLLIGLGLVALSSRDDTLLADDDLRLPGAPKVPAAENAYLLLRDLGVAVDGGSELDLAALDAALEAPHYRWYASTRFDTPDLTALLQLSRALDSLLEEALDSDELARAREIGVWMLELGDRVQRGGTTIIEYLVGCALMGAAVESLTQTVIAGPPDLAECRRLTDLLRDSSPRVESLRRAIQGEYCFFVEAILSYSDGEELVGYEEGLSRHALLFKPNRTRNLATVRYREMVRLVELPYQEWLVQKPQREPSSLVGGVIRGNYVGEMLLDMSTLSVDTLVERRFPLSAYVSCAQVAIALAAYEKENGDLPASLNELVPRYLDAVPLDPFDGQPIRYSKASKSVYSVGDDLKDEGGGIVTGSDSAEPTVSLVPVSEPLDPEDDE